MRIRNVKPEFYRSDDIDALTWEQRFLFVALFSYVDDNGVGRDRESDICADLFAGDFSVHPTETLGRVRHCLLALCKRGLVVRYEVDGKRFIFITGWDSHQYVKNPNQPRYPRPDKALLQASVDAGEALGSEGVDATPDLPPVVGSKLLVSKTSSSADADGMFDEFWSVYPRKVSKQDARKRWAVQVKTTDPQKIVDGARKYAASVRGVEPEKIKHPDGWLLGQRWNDDLAQHAEINGTQRRLQAVPVSPPERPLPEGVA